MLAVAGTLVVLSLGAMIAIVVASHLGGIDYSGRDE